MAVIKVSPLVRISIGLVLITLSIVLLGELIGLIPDKHTLAMEARKYTAESLAVQCTMAARNNNVSAIKKTMDVIVKLHPDILSLGMRGIDGRYHAQTQDHQKYWIAPQGEDSTSTHWQVPIYLGEKRWGTIEFSFTPIGSNSVLGFKVSTITLLLAFFALASFLFFLLFMKRTLRHLDPTTVMPGRVKYALDTLTEGVILVDTHERVILANAALAEKLGCTIDSLLGIKASDIKWIDPDTGKPLNLLPWKKTMSEGEIQSGILVGLKTKSQDVRTFMANIAPILDDKGKSRGALATFDDVTEIQSKNMELSEMLKLLQQSSYKLELQNQELEILATRDSLTGCLNRRAFFERAEQHLAAAITEESNLSAIMLDIDHFKSFNDTYGHATGDEVIRSVAKTLQSAVRRGDIVCRYGGEEFCLLLPNCDIDKAAEIAENLRKEIASKNIKVDSSSELIHVTASFGVSDVHLGADTIDELLAQADRALYKAKDYGRNQVVLWDNVKESEFLQQVGK